LLVVIEGLIKLAEITDLGWPWVNGFDSGSPIGSIVATIPIRFGQPGDRFCQLNRAFLLKVGNFETDVREG
jgi:hypothetical protein